MSLQFVASLIVLSIIGIGVAGFLTWQHFNRKKQPLLCPINHDCSKVTESKWSTVFGVRNEQLGLLFFSATLISAILTLVVTQFTQLLYLLNLVASALSVPAVFFLIYIQFAKIKDYCFYCLTSSLIIFLVFLNNLVLYLGF